MDSKSLLVQITLSLAHKNPLNEKGLIDSGCSRRAFLSNKLVRKHNLPTRRTPYPRTLLLADGRTTDVITHYTILPTSIGNHFEYCLFFITTLSDDTPVILGLPWLKHHNPQINWAAMSLTFNSPYCLTYCCPPGLTAPPTAPTVPDPPRSFHDLPSLLPLTR